MWPRVGVVEMPGWRADEMHISVRLLDVREEAEVSTWNFGVAK